MTGYLMPGEIEAAAHRDGENGRFSSHQSCDNREPSTRGEVLSCGGCRCGGPRDHDWAGKAEGAPHPRRPWTS